MESRESLPALSDSLEWSLRALLFSAISYSLIMLTCVTTIIVWRIIAPWLEGNQELAGWGQTFGGILAVVATSIIATSEARRSRKSLEAQIKMQDRELSHNSDLDKQSKAENRRAAIGCLEGAEAIICSMVTVLHEDSDPGTPFLKTWKDDIDFAKKLISGVQYNHLGDNDAVRRIAKCHTCVSDIQRYLEIIAIADPGSRRQLCYRYMTKGSLQRIRQEIVILDQNCKFKNSKELVPTPEEKAAYDAE